MSDITINYKGSAIATMDASGSTSLLTEGKYCEDDIDVVYVKPSGGGTLDLPWITRHETVTIGANSTAKMSDVVTYFNSYKPYFMIVLQTAPDTDNQAVAIGINAAAALRYKNGVVASSGITSSYDGLLIEGTKYDIYYF